MAKITFLQFGDLHLERGNLDISVPPIRRIAEIAEERRPDLAVFTGDAVTKRGAFHPEAAFEFRSLMERVQAVSKYTVAIDGNHDVSFDGSKSFVVGALADQYGQMFQGVNIISGGPRVLDTGLGVTILGIPTFDRFILKAALEESPDETAEGLVGMAVRGGVATAHGFGQPIVVAYHGSLSGARLGNEQVIRAGIDVPVDPASFVGAAAVLLGHIHKPQVLNGPGGIPMIYNGATCPLDWGEKAIEPGVVWGTIDTETGAVEFERLPLPVVSDMIEREVLVTRFEASGSEAMNVVEFLSSASGLADIPRGARLRIKFKAPGSVIDTIPRNIEETLAEWGGLRSVNLIKERIDETVRAQTMDRRVSVVEALRVWIQEQLEQDDSLRDAVLALAQEIEQEVRDEDLDAAFDFRPISLRVKNWCQYDEAEIEFDQIQGVTMIRGANTAGKSNLARAIPFALYKVQRAGDVMSDLIRNGEDKAEVELVFEARGEIYRIRRVMKRGKDRGASSVLFFDAIDQAGAWSPVVEGTEPETQAKIAELVGPSDLFFAAAYADQDAISSVLNLRPAEMKDLLAQVLHRDFQGRVDRVRRMRATSEEARKKAQAVIEELTVTAGNVAEWQADLQAQSQRRADLRTAMDALGPDDPLVSRVEAAVAEVAKLREEAKATEQATLDLADCHTKLANLRRAVGEAEQAKATVEVAAGEVLALGLKREALAGFENDGGRFAAEERETRAARQRAADVLNELTRSRLARVGKAEKATASATQDVQRLEAELTEARAVAGLVDRVPCGGAIVGGPGGEVIDCSICPLIERAVQKRADLVHLASQAAEARSAYEGAKVALGSALEADKDEMQAAEAEVGRLDEEITKAEIAARVHATGMASLRQEIAGLEAAERRMLAARPVADRLAGLREELAAETARADRLIGVVGATDVADRIAGAQQEEEEARRALAKMQADRRDLDRTLAGYAETIARLESRIEAAQEAVSRLDELTASVADREREIRTFSLYEQALGRDGVPFLLLELYAIPEIRDRVNHYLEPTPWRIQIETERRAVTAGMKPGVYIAFTDANGLHPLSSSSGSQAVSLGASMRQGIADLHAAATGTRIRLSVQDEGFGAYDQENLRGAVETIRKIAEAREVFMFVSHIDSMDACADHIINVIPAASGSRIELEEVQS